MSNIKDAITAATREALKSYLAPDLVEQLTEEIIHRAAPQMEEALRTMAGFELSRPGAVRQKPPQSSGRKTHKADKKSNKDEADRAPVYLTQGSDSLGHKGPSAQEAPMHLS